MFVFNYKYVLNGKVNVQTYQPIHLQELLCMALL